MPGSFRRTRAAKLYLLVVAIYLGSALPVSFFVLSWSSTDWYAISVGVALFLLGIRLREAQSRLQRVLAELMVLDGSHRACAALVYGLPFTALVVSIAGPLDRSVLPGLAHWGG